MGPVRDSELGIACNSQQIENEYLAETMSNLWPPFTLDHIDDRRYKNASPILFSFMSIALYVSVRPFSGIPINKIATTKNK